MTQQVVRFSEVILEIFYGNYIHGLIYGLQDVGWRRVKCASYRMLDIVQEVVGGYLADRTAAPIGDMLRNEELFCMMKLSCEQIKEKILKLTKSLLERIYHKVVVMMHDTKIMAKELMRKAVNYSLNQWNSLRNILKDGAAEISNNLCE